jgi:hypothetical protein
MKSIRIHIFGAWFRRHDARPYLHGRFGHSAPRTDHYDWQPTAPPDKGSVTSIICPGQDNFGCGIGQN